MQKAGTAEAKSKDSSMKAGEPSLSKTPSYMGENVDDEFEEMKGNEADSQELINNSYDLGSRDESYSSSNNKSQDEVKRSSERSKRGGNRDDGWINNTWQYTVLVPLAE